MSRFEFQAIGTSWKIDFTKELAPSAEAGLLRRIMERIGIFDKVYSRFRADSIITKISKKAGIYELPNDAKPMMDLYRDLYWKTGGQVTPLIGNLISDAGYDARYSLVQKKELEAPPAWDDVIEYEHPKLTVKKSVLLDFGAAGKGYLIDIVGGLLEANGVSDFCIDAGGDILHKGKTAVRVGLEDPEDKGKVIGVYSLKDGSICGSAGNRRKWGKFTHIINPKTLESPSGIAAVWVTAKTALEADGLATCLFFVGPEKLVGYDFEYLIVRSDRSIEKSVGFKGEIFSV